MGMGMDVHVEVEAGLDGAAEETSEAFLDAAAAAAAGTSPPFSASHSAAGRLYLEDAAEAQDAAQANLLNFAEVFAPVLLAAQSVEQAKQEGRRDHTAMLAEKAAADAARADHRGSSRSLRLLEGCMQAVESFERTVVPSLSSSRHTPSDTEVAIPTSALTPNGRLPLQRLVDGLGASLGGTVNLLLKDTPSLHVTEGDSAFGSVNAGLSDGGSGERCPRLRAFGS